MRDLSEHLASEGVRSQPASQLPFTDLVRAHSRRQQRNRLITGAAMVVLVGAPGSAAMSGNHAVPAGRPDDLVGAPAGPLTNPVTATGSLQQIGGPLGMPPRGTSGTVWFQAEDGTITSATTSGSGQFSITVAAGRYVVTGALGSGDPTQPSCQADAPVIAPSDGLERVEVTCHIR